MWLGSSAGVWAGWPDHPQAAGGEFHFVRLAYRESLYEPVGYGRWLTDWPDAEEHLLDGVRRLTLVDAAAEPRTVKLSDEGLFEQPWLYAVEVGSWSLDDAEAARLREYLLRGGFLMVDDFHGNREWRRFVAGMSRVFPDRPIVDVAPEDPVFHVVYDVDAQTQIPGISPVMNGVTHERDGVRPYWRGIYDDDGHLMVMINFNMDLGDAWEHADEPIYPLHFTTLAYQYAINYIVYAMTH